MQSSVASVLPTPTADLTSRLRQLMQLRSVYPEIQRGSFFFFFPTVQHVFPSHGLCCESVHFSLRFRKVFQRSRPQNTSPGFDRRVTDVRSPRGQRFNLAWTERGIDVLIWWRCSCGYRVTGGGKELSNCRRGGWLLLVIGELILRPRFWFETDAL